MLLLLLLAVLLHGLFNAWSELAPERRFGRRLRHPRAETHGALFCKKPQWVIDEIIRLKAHLGDAGCRTLAHTFNRMHGRRETVSKSFVASVVRNHRLAILRTRRELRRRKPVDPQPNRRWGLDLTGKQDAHGVVHSILGIVDHGSRMAITLERVPALNAWTVAGYLLIAIGRFGRPAAIRTDNGQPFASQRFALVLRLLGIRHERSEVGCPWMNGRIERLFGTLKRKLDQVAVRDSAQLDLALRLFAEWYNRVRPHDALNGCTPHEVWFRVNPFTVAPKSVEPYSAWDGLLTGVRLRW